MLLDNLPRYSLGFLPTPLHPLPNLSARLGGPAIWVKRDDQTGLATGGNKTRKLEFLLGLLLLKHLLILFLFQLLQDQNFLQKLFYHVHNKNYLLY